MRLHFALIAAAAAWGTMAQADCASDADVATFVMDYVAMTPTKALLPGGTMADALCTQAKLVAALGASMGPVVGYKAGLTSKPAQERFGVTEPVRGVLYRDVMLTDGAKVPVPWGARPVLEADLILVIGDAGVNAAASSAEVMAHVSAVHPFIELPDLALAEDQPFTGVTLTAMGVGARLGVLGAAIPVTDAGAMHHALAAMTVTLSAADGEVLAEVPGTAVLGHPANSVLWLIGNGVVLKPGDMVSVGSFGPLVPPAKSKGGASASYTGLPGNPQVSVVFE